MDTHKGDFSFKSHFRCGFYGSSKWRLWGPLLPCDNDTWPLPEFSMEREESVEQYLAILRPGLEVVYNPFSWLEASLMVLMEL